LAHNYNNNNNNGEDDDFKKMLEGFENLKTVNTKAVSELRQKLLAQKNFLSLSPEKQQEIIKAKTTTMKYI
jgi:dsDNA-binding SOS-regulon protein